VSGITFDAGALIALERNDRRVVTLTRTALDDGDPIDVPATALAQVLRNPARQVRLWRLIHHDRTRVVPLDVSDAQEVGVLLARSATSDIVDAQVAVCARKSGRTVITSVPLDLKRLHPELRIVSV
jgi:hypothetical protein